MVLYFSKLPGSELVLARLDSSVGGIPGNCIAVWVDESSNVNLCNDILKTQPLTDQENRKKYYLDYAENPVNGVCMREGWVPKWQ